MANKGHDVTVYATNVLSEEKLFIPKKSVYNINGVKVHYYRNFIYKPHLPIPFFYSGDLVKNIKENLAKYDIVHLHEYRFYISPIVHFYAKKYGVPYVLQAHGSLPRIMAKQKLKWIYDVLFGYRLLRDASKVIALSRMEAEQYRGMGVPEEKIAAIPNGIDLSEYANLPPKYTFKKKFNIREDVKVILYLGRIHQSKGIDVLIKAYSHMIKRMKCENTLLVIAGPDDGYLHEVKSLVKSLSICDSVLFTGFISTEDKRKALVDAYVFVTPSFYGLPITFLEACAVGVPIVTTTNELDWIHNNIGYVVEKSPVVLAKAISDIIRDEQTHENFKKNAELVIKNFDISTIASRIENTYESIAL